MAELSMSKLSMSNTKEEPAASMLGAPAQSPPMVLATDGPAVRQAIGQLLSRARHSISLIVPGTFERAKPILPLMGRFTAVAGTGVTVRVLCAPQVLARSASSPPRGAARWAMRSGSRTWICRGP
ncbi:hypothetical protein SAZ11_32180 [Streptomyces sp. FXJ1.4098]|nr:hypothetical protein [Streptomyces sp. FXJ1.4098]